MKVLFTDMKYMPPPPPPPKKKKKKKIKNKKISRCGRGSGQKMAESRKYSMIKITESEFWVPMEQIDGDKSIGQNFFFLQVLPTLGKYKLLCIVA